MPERPTALAVGPDGDLYIADPRRDQILKLLPNGTFVVVAGTGTAGFSGDGGPAVDAEINQPEGMAFSPDGSLYFADEQNFRVREISPSGIISTVVGDGTVGNGYVADGTQSSTAAFYPNDVTFGPDGHLYIATNAQVLRLESDDTLTRIVGGSVPEGDVHGIGGPAVEAGVGSVNGLAFDSAGDLYLWDFDTKTIFMVAPDGRITEPAGTESLYPHGDGGLRTGPDGNVVAMGELSIVKLSPSGIQTMFSFPANIQQAFDGIHGFSPNGIAIGSDATIYVDTFYGNGFTDTSAIAAIDLSTGSSRILWEQRQ